MPSYRVLCLEGSKIAERSDFEVEDDDEALVLFALRGEKADCEIWHGDRKVAMIPKGANPRLAGRHVL